MSPVDRAAADRLLDDARSIAFPRYPGTTGDRLVRGIVARHLREAGLDVVEEGFRYDLRPALRALRGALVASAVLVAAAGLTARVFPIVALLLLAAGIAVGAVLLGWAPRLSRLYAGDGPTETANVVGRRRGVEPRSTFVLMAHHDSKSQSLSLPWRLGLTLLALASVLGLAVLLALSGFTPGAADAAPTLSLLGAGALLVLATLRSGNRSPGGIDNAGSVAVVLELARTLPREVPGDVELVFLSTGAEEDHMIGALRWLDRHAGELASRSTYALNFDGVGAPGRSVLIERFGFGRAFAPALAATARRAATRLGIPLRRIWMPPAIGIDAIPFAERGIPCLTLSSGSLGRATLAVHSADDVAGRLDPAVLARTVELARAIVRDVTRDHGHRPSPAASSGTTR